MFVSNLLPARKGSAGDTTEMQLWRAAALGPAEMKSAPWARDFMKSFLGQASPPGVIVVKKYVFKIILNPYICSDIQDILH